MVVPVSVPTTPKVDPIVAELLTVSALAVTLPLDPTEVNNAVLGATLPIGVACRPPNALNVVLNVPLLLTVNAFTVVLACTVNVLAIVALPVNNKLPVLTVPYVPVMILPDSLITFE